MSWLQKTRARQQKNGNGYPGNPELPDPKQLDKNFESETRSRDRRDLS